MTPRLLVAAHGTRYAPGNAVARNLAAAAARRLGAPVRAVYLELRRPLLADELAVAAALLAAAWGGEVRLATVTGTGGRVADLVGPGVAVSPYLLATGHFAARATAEATAEGSTRVAEVLGAHPQVVALVVERLAALAGRWGCAEATPAPGGVGVATTW